MRIQLQQIAITTFTALAMIQASAIEDNSTLNDSNLNRLSQITCNLSPAEDPQLPAELNLPGKLKLTNIQSEPSEYTNDTKGITGDVQIKIGKEIAFFKQGIKMDIARKTKCDNSPCGSVWAGMNDDLTPGLRYIQFQEKDSHPSAPFLLTQKFNVVITLKTKDQGTQDGSDYFAYTGTCTYKLGKK